MIRARWKAGFLFSYTTQMQFINDKCDCCDDRVLAIEFRIDDVQQAEDGTLLLTFSEEELDTIYTDMTRALAKKS
jgi:hypothetical protein